MKVEGPSAKNKLILRQLTRLVEISVQLNSTLDPDQLLRFIIETAADLLECETASILLYNENMGDLSFISSSGPDSKKLAQLSVPIEGSIAGLIYSSNQPMVINQADQDPRVYTHVGTQLNFQTKSLIGVPMRIKDRVMGVLEALNKRTGEFNQGDIDLLFIIADQAAVAIHNAQLVQKLQRAYDDLSRVDKIKSDFIAVASHELRTPLGVILGYASFLADEAKGELSDHAQHVMKAAIQMRGLVQAMTNLNMMEMGSLQLEPSNVILQDVIRSVCEDQGSSIQEKQLRLSCDLPPQPVEIIGDHEKLKKVFSNLLDNAVRFTPDGGSIGIRLSATPHQALVEVSDNGIGIPAFELENIFKPTYQVEGHLTRRYGGMGLGLAIAKGLVNLHRGRIWAESAGVGKGTTIKVSLPIEMLPNQ